MNANFRRVEIQQDTRAWHDWRRQGIGATEARAVRAGGKGAKRLLREKTGKEEERDFQSAAMVRGKDLESEARAAYIKEVGITVKPACVENIKTPWLRASLDGISNDEKRIVEIKCGERIYNSVKSNGKVPKEYVAQTQHILATTGLESLDFWCYAPGFNGIRIPVSRDERYIDELLNKEQSFWTKVLDESGDSPSASRSLPGDVSEPIVDHKGMLGSRQHRRMEKLIERLSPHLGFGGQSPTDLPRLTILNLGLSSLEKILFPGLKVLPPEIGDLTNLTHLNLAGNQLTALPPEIGNLTNLTSLRLNDNQLTALPPQVGRLTSLTTLRANRNRLTGIPHTIAELVNIQKFTKTIGGLDLSNNLLTVLPPGVVSGFEANEIFWEKRPDLDRDEGCSTYKLDLSGNPLRADLFYY